MRIARVLLCSSFGLLGASAGAQVVIPGVAGTPVVNPITNKIYAGDATTLIEVDGATHAIRTAAGSDLGTRIVDPVQDRIWILNFSLDSVTVVEGTDLSMQTVAVGDGPLSIALDPAANVAWVLNRDGSATRIDGSDLSADAIPLGLPVLASGFVVADPIGARAFANGAGQILEIDRATLGVQAQPGGSDLAVNPTTARLFTFTTGPFDPDLGDSELRLTRIDANTQTVIGHSVVSFESFFPRLLRIASDPVHGRIWFEHSKTVNDVQALVEADGSSAGVFASTGGGGSGSAGWAFNPASNRLYLLGGFAAPPQWEILDADSGSRTLEFFGSLVHGVAVNPATNLTYRSHGTELVETPEPETTAVPITTAISNDPPTGGTVDVHFAAASGFAPIAPPIGQIFYRVDGTSGPWTAATPAGASASATLSLSPGVHTVHAFAVDGQEATIGHPQRTTPIVGQVASLAVTMPSTCAGAGNTGFLSPTAQLADSGGDGDGFELTPQGAFADGGTPKARNRNGPGDRHRWHGYGVAVPAGCAVLGIEVRADWRLDSKQGVNALAVELSSDGGASWTAAKIDPIETTAEHTVVLGGAADTWGRSWSAADVADPGFRVRVTAISDKPARDWFVDWIPVRVTWGP